MLFLIYSLLRKLLWVILLKRTHRLTRRDPRLPSQGWRQLSRCGQVCVPACLCPPLVEAGRRGTSDLGVESKEKEMELFLFVYMPPPRR